MKNIKSQIKHLLFSPIGGKKDENNKPLRDSEPSSQFSILNSKFKTGAALLLVLGCVVLMSSMVTGFLSNATQGLRRAKVSEGISNTKLLAETPVNIVIGQIRQATPDSSTTNWISQPGLIRTYDTTGQQTGAYKLYSSSKMIVSGSSFNPVTDISDSETGIPNDWVDRPAEFVDLNDPVLVEKDGESNVPIFPILDPRAMVSTSSNLVEGFFYTNTIAGVTMPSGSANDQRCPMPVQWLYVMQDGSMGTMKDGTSDNPIVGRVGFWTDDETCKVNVNTASEGVFWDIPRTVGVQVNQDGYYTPTDNALAHSQNRSLDQEFKDFLPVRREFQRTSGHPAMNCLSPIFKTLLPRPSMKANAMNRTGDGLGYDANDAVFFNRYYHLVPRVNFSTNTVSALLTGVQTTPVTRYPGQGAGSQSGTVFCANPPINADLDRDSQIIVSDTDRFFATVNDMLFSYDGSAAAPHAANISSPTETETREWRELLTKSGFFLTSNSVAPDLNLFGKPRVSIWPLTHYNGALSFSDQWHETANNQRTAVIRPTRTPEENLIDQATRLGAETGTEFDLAYRGRRYSFYRNIATRCDIPAAGSNSSDYIDGSVDGDRNLELYQYLQRLTSATIPGYGSKLSTKYGNNTNAILTEMCDYIRLVNMQCPVPILKTPAGAAAQSASFDNTKNIGYYYGTTVGGDCGANASLPPISLVKANSISMGQVAPLQIGNSRGFGRAPFISEVGLVFYASEIYPSAAYPLTNPYPAQPTIQGKGWTDAAFDDAMKTAVLTDATEGPRIGRAANVRCAFLFNYGSVAQGYPALCPAMDVELTGTVVVTFKSSTGHPNLAHTFNFPNNTTAAMPALPTTGTVNYFTSVGGNTGVVAQDRTDAATRGIGISNMNALAGNIRGYKFLNSYRSSTNDNLYPLNSLPYTTNDLSHYQTFDITSVDLTAKLYIRNWNSTGSDSSNLKEAQLLATYRFTQNGITAKPLPVASALTKVLTSNFAGRTDVADWGAVDATTAGQKKSVINAYYSDLVKGATTYNKPCISIERRTNADEDMATICPGDVVLGWSYGTNAAGSGDFKMLALSLPTTEVAFTPHPLNTSTTFTSIADASGLVIGSFTPAHIIGDAAMHDGVRHYQLLQGVDMAIPFASASGEGNSFSRAVPTQFTVNEGVRMLNGNRGDWDNISGVFADGVGINMPDNASVGFYGALQDHQYSAQYNSYYSPVQSNTGITDTSFSVYYSPNRQVASPIVFGSLSSRPVDGNGWETLLFCPNPSAGSATNNHRGFGTVNVLQSTRSSTATVPDHLWLDLFRMPVVEPFPISDPLSAKGRVNINYQIVPFTHIKRATGMYSLLTSLMLTGIYSGNTGDNWNTRYETYQGAGNTNANTYDSRFNINVPVTLEGFESRFNSNAPFRSASEICEMFLAPDPIKNASGAVAAKYPAGLTYPAQYSAIDDWWANFLFTGDNSREQPYNHLYNRICTQSNTYTVYVIAQSLKKSKFTPAGEFQDGKDQVLGTWRGSYAIERYIDPNDSRLNTAAMNSIEAAPVASGGTLNPYYKFRVLRTNQFSP